MNSTGNKKPFHLAFPVVDLEKTKEFYIEVLGCNLGRSAFSWMDFDFFGNQLTAHENQNFEPIIESICKNNESYPIVHFGVILEWKEWHEFKKRLIDLKVSFLIEPHVAFLGEVGEQWSLFVKDPSGYAIEFKTFENPDNVFTST